MEGQPPPPEKKGTPWTLIGLGVVALYVILLLGIAFYGVSYFVRGWLAGHQGDAPDQGPGGKDFTPPGADQDEGLTKEAKALALLTTASFVPASCITVGPQK